MKKHLLLLSSILFFFFYSNKAPAHDIVSNGANTKPINFPAGSRVYTWGNDNAGFDLAAANVLRLISTTTIAVESKIPGGLYPTSLGNFVTAGMNCTELVKYVITVNLTPALLPTITTGAAIGGISACAGTASAEPQILQFTVSGSNLTGNITATAPAGFEVSLAAADGYGSSIAIPQTSGTVSSAMVYVRSAATAPVGSVSGNVTLISAGASNQTVAVTGTVNALLTLNAVANQMVNNGAATAAVNFTGTGNTFTWVNDTPGIGLAASGTGNIASFIAKNTRISAVKATITAMPAPAVFAYIANLIDGTVSVIDIATNVVPATIKVGQQPVCVSLSPDGNRAYVTNQRDNTVSVIDTKSNIVISTIPVNYYPLGIAVSPDNSKVYVVNHNIGNISVINTASNTVVANILESSDIWDVRVSPDGNKLYATDYSSNTVTVININTGATITKIPMGPFPLELSFTPDGSRLYVTNTKSNIVSVVNTSTNAVVANIVVGLNPKGIAVTPDGKSVYVSNYSDGTVSVISTTSNIVIATIAVGTNPYGVSVSADGASVLVTNTNSNNVSVINTATNTVINTIHVGNYPESSGNLISSRFGCGGSPVTFTITVNPTIPAITATTATGTISACAGTASVNPQIQQFTVSGSNLTGSVTATTPAGFEISLAAASGYGSSIAISQTSGTVSSTVVYVRSAATAPAGSISGNVTLTSAGASNQTVAVTGTVNALPTVNAAANQTVNNGAVTAAVNFTGTANTFAWVNDTPGIGLAASGTGNIASFTANNVGSTPVTATITVSPVTSGFAYIVNENSNTISVINTESHMVVSTIQTNQYPGGVSVSPDGSEVYVANRGSNSISVINTLTNSIIGTIPAGPSPSSVCVNPAGSLLYVCNYSSQTISVVNISTSKVVATIGIASEPAYLAVSPDGSRLYVTSNGSNNVYVINTASNTVIATIPVGTILWGLVVSPDGSRLYVADSGSETVSVINTSTNTVVAVIPVSSPVDVAISPDGSMLYVSENSSNAVLVINTSTNTVVTTIRVGANPWGISVSPDGSEVYVANGGSNNVSVINTITNKVLTTVHVGSNPVSFGNFITAGTGCSGPSGKFKITVNPNLTLSPTITAGTATGTISACAGAASASPQIQQFTVSGSGLTANITATAPAGFELSLTAGSGYGSSLTILQTSGTVSGTVVYARSAASLPNGTTTANVLLSSSGATGQTVSVTGIINPMVAPTLMISSSQNNICPGTNVTFTASSTNGGNSPVYQWLLNGNNTGTNSPSYASSTLSNGDIVSCRVTSNAACLTIPDATSNSIAMIVNGQVAPTVSISMSANNVCAGTLVTFTASPTNGGSTPGYQWLLNGSNTGTNNPTFSSSTFANGDAVSCVVTSSSACATPVSTTSNSIITNIFPLPVVNAGGDKTIEKGNSVALIATASGNIADITWSPSAGLDNNKILHPRAGPASTTLYTITVQTAAGCIAQDAVTVTVFDGITIPNTFTPNGDGVNDKWDIKNLNDYPNCAMQIFDRYGGAVYNSKGHYNAWDGTMNGRPLPAGIYYYLINLNNGTHPFSGFVALIR